MEDSRYQVNLGCTNLVASTSDAIHAKGYGNVGMNTSVVFADEYKGEFSRYLQKVLYPKMVNSLDKLSHVSTADMDVIVTAHIVVTKSQEVVHSRLHTKTIKATTVTKWLKDRYTKNKGDKK